MRLSELPGWGLLYKIESICEVDIPYKDPRSPFSSDFHYLALTQDCILLCYENPQQGNYLATIDEVIFGRVDLYPLGINWYKILSVEMYNNTHCYICKSNIGKNRIICPSCEYDDGKERICS